MLTKEQLLQTRYKVTGPFPHMNCKVGDILDFSDGYSSKQITRTPHDDPWGETNFATHGFDQFELQEYPNLFQPLPWYSDRKPEDMPEYLKDIKTGEVFAYDENYKAHGTAWMSDHKIEPATKEDYQVYVSIK